MPRTSATVLAVKTASVNADGSVTLPLLLAREGWGELRGTVQDFRAVSDAIAPVIGAPRIHARKTPEPKRAPLFKAGRRLP